MSHVVPGHISCIAVRPGSRARVLRGLLLLAAIFIFTPCWARTAADILDRPNREAEERAAWHPEPMSWDEFTDPTISLKDHYSIRQMPTRGFWMDNRYVMGWYPGSEIPSADNRQSYLGIVDTDTGEVFKLKEGFLRCFRHGQIAYDAHVGYVATLPIDGRRYYGTLGHEVEVPWGWRNESGRLVEYSVNRVDCANIPRSTAVGYDIGKAKDLFGIYINEDGKETPRRSYIPLLPGHGFLSADNEAISRLPRLERRNSRGISWFGPTEKRVDYPDLSRINDIPALFFSPEQYSPFLDRYVFYSSTLLSFSLSSAAVRGGDPDDEIYGMKLHLVLFSPTDGSIRRIARPEWLLNHVQAHAVRLTRAGLLWIGGVGTPGLFLSRGEEVKKLFDYRVSENTLTISPNGCRVLFSHRYETAPRPARMSGPLGAILDFTPNKSNNSEYLMIDFCEGK